MKNTKWISDELNSIIIAREKQSLFWFWVTANLETLVGALRLQGRACWAINMPAFSGKYRVWSLNARATGLVNRDCSCTELGLS